MHCDSATTGIVVLAIALLTTACAATPPPPPCTQSPAAPPQPCSKSGVAVHLLGSGGPIPDDARASSGTLIWVDGRARVLIDAGGGVFQRFGEAGAKLEDLDLIAVTHLHTDHVSDLPALLKGGYFSDRRRALPLAGPTGNERFPSISAFLALQFGKDTGAYRYLSWLLDDHASLFSLAVREVDASSRVPVPILAMDDLVVDAIGVHHGPVPTLAIRVTAKGKRIVVGADGSGRDDAFLAFAQSADVLVLPHAIPEGAGEGAGGLHVRPSELAQAAARTHPKRLVLNHHMQRSLKELDTTLAAVAKAWDGPVVVGTDLMCIPVD